jgi:hypothetical protein
MCYNIYIIFVLTCQFLRCTYFMHTTGLSPPPSDGAHAYSCRILAYCVDTAVCLNRYIIIRPHSKNRTCNSLPVIRLQTRRVKYKVIQIWPGLIAACLHTNQSRSYLNHLVHSFPAERKIFSNLSEASYNEVLWGAVQVYKHHSYQLHFVKFRFRHRLFLECFLVYYTLLLPELFAVSSMNIRRQVAKLQWYRLIHLNFTLSYTFQVQQQRIKRHENYFQKMKTIITCLIRSATCKF